MKSNFIKSVNDCFLVAVLLYLYIPFCNAQSNKVEDSKGKIIIDLDKININPDVEFLTSMVFKRIKIIPLETNESCLIGGIHKIQVFDQYILVADFTINSLFVFNKEGRFIRRIGGIGQGPGEFVSINDFTIDRINKTVYISDGRLSRINKYDLETGKFIQSFRNAGSGRSNRFESIWGKLYSDAFFAEHSANNYLLYIIDESTGKEKSNFLNVMEYNKGVSNTLGANHFPPFYLRDNGDGIFVQPFMNHIIEITKEGVFSFIELKGKNLLTPEEAKRAKELLIFKIPPKMLDILKIDKYLRIITFIEKGDWIIFDMTKGLRVHRFLINKKTKEVSIFEKAHDDLLFANKRGEMPAFGCYDANGVYFHTDSPESTSKFQAQLKAGTISSDISGLEFLKNLKKDDNPILFYYEFKE